ncbi:MAG: hypothetical protein HQL16_00155 [Candidatus Omnitrophica bacterium]|nr:hypothetical protein [Candidatus Omnitrophota bacterium]
MKENLIIAAVGDRSFHRSWIKGKNRLFDVLLIYYGNESGKYLGDADYYLETQVVGKFQKIFLAIEKYHEEVSCYKYVCLADDDIISSTDAFNRLFEKFNHYGLDAGQPSISGGFIGHWITTRHWGCELRYVNFVEGMCPVFKSGLLLQEILPYLIANRSAWGIEWLWASVLVNKKVAILDCVSVRHKSFLDSAFCMLFHHKSDYYLSLRRTGVSIEKDMKDAAESVAPEIRKSLFLEKGRIRKPLGLRILLSPLMLYGLTKWTLYFMIIKHFDNFFLLANKILFKFKGSPGLSAVNNKTGRART